MIVRLDGSHGEGGGQIVRTSVALAAITGRAVEVDNVRARRDRPGLQPQHLAAVKAAAALCDANVRGASVGSARLSFDPRAPVRAGEYRFDVGTAGSTTLVAQTVMLALALASDPSSVEIIGGTHQPHAPPAEYLSEVYAPIVGARARYESAGWYPRGGGRLLVDVDPVTLQRIERRERGRVRTVDAYVVCSRLPAHVAQRGTETVRTELEDVDVQVREPWSPGPGAAVVIVARTDAGACGFTALGARGRPMEDVAREACAAYREWESTGAACDEHLADQLVLPAALAGGGAWTTNVATEHVRTVVWCVQHFVDIRSEIREDGLVRLG